LTTFLKIVAYLDFLAQGWGFPPVKGILPPIRAFFDTLSGTRGYLEEAFSHVSDKDNVEYGAKRECISKFSEKMTSYVFTTLK
jgi:hypothetical protein